jgi:hypothetical protein
MHIYAKYKLLIEYKLMEIQLTHKKQGLMKGKERALTRIRVQKQKYLVSTRFTAHIKYFFD